VSRFKTVDYALEVIAIPVTDVDRAKDFYVSQAGFALDVDYTPNPDFRVVQLTPPGSSCSIQVGVGITTAAPGSLRDLCLVVTDLEQACRELAERGVEVGEIRHKASVAGWQGDFTPGIDPSRRDYASFADFQDPDGNTWVLQERGFSTPAS
jgi:catechol 2,3-dioxygenase-like lactoylglutathione lyase family enzyme